MKSLVSWLKKRLDVLFNTRAAGLYILLFALSIAVGTFIENDFGTSSAQKIIYKSWWFSLLLLLFCITIAVNILRFRMVQLRKWPLFIFHAAMIIILMGSGVTRYFGFEGIMHIREGDASNRFLSSETYLQFEVIKNDRKYHIEEPVLFASLGDNSWKQSYLVENSLIEVAVKEFIPNPVQMLQSDEAGFPTFKIVFGGAEGREEYYLSYGERRNIRNVVFNFTDSKIPEAFNIAFRNDSLLLQSDRKLFRMIMATQQKDTLLPDLDYHELMLRSLYSDGLNSFVFGEFNESAIVNIASENKKLKSESLSALNIEVSINGNKQEVYVYGQKGIYGKPAIVSAEDVHLSANYGAKFYELPFSLKLHDFQMERYPGTNNPTSFASEVQLIDHGKNVKEDHRIYMNHVLDYKGYRFFQSSYDRDELGTYLSVNHDFWGTWISYFGYILVTIGMVLSLFSKKSRFSYLSEQIKRLRNNRSAFIIILSAFGFAPSVCSAQKVVEQNKIENIVSADHAALVSNLVVQDHNGRMKPIHTLSREVLRKVARTESVQGLNADQVLLGMYVDSRQWINVPMIRLGKHELIRELIGVTGSMASYSDFFNEKGQYILQEEVSKALNAQPVDRGVFEKELLKLDEKVNIVNMVYSGHLFKIIPVPNDPNNSWASGHTAKHNSENELTSVADKFFAAYGSALRKAMETGDYSYANKIVTELDSYQKQEGGNIMPSDSVIKTEIFLNKLDPFNRLGLLYVFLGLAFLVFLFWSVFNPYRNFSTVYVVLFSVLMAGVLFHTIGLGLRWYVSGRAPWSNGYESMIYIAWTTLLAGVIFTRRSFGGLAATTVLAATVLMVARLSYLDPEITPLVPVLRSYWLTIHVSLEAGSYGFLMLGAVIGLINLVLMIFLTQKNKEQVYRIIKEMTYLSEMTLIGGLFMISIGTYLGGVWANESWGRYWGWDAKETWALVTILVYAFILHMRLIPNLKGIFSFNFASIFGLASVIMTYYGVNYYLSGLHSYAAGDPVPVPQWVYIMVCAILLISIAAFWRQSKIKLKS